MAGSTTKKAIIRRYDREPLAGYLNPVSYLQPAGVELLSAQGAVTVVPLADIKTISFVREFGTASESDRRIFPNRPKMEGLWVSFRFRDDEVLEGIMPNNLLQIEPHGFTIVPPDPHSANQRVFIPRAALASVEVLGVVGSPLRKRRVKAAPKDQIGLFDE